MVRTVGLVLTAMAFAAPSMAPVSPQEPALPDALARTAGYVADYRVKASGVSLEEQFMLTETGPVQPIPRRVASDLVLINITEGLMGLRDPFALDTRAVRERQPRIIQALAEPTMASWQRVQEFARAGAHLLLANIVLWYSDPMLALRFIESAHQPGMTYKLEGRKKMNGLLVYGIGFKEKQEEGKAYLMGTPSNPASSGRIWIDAATGAIHQTELWIQSDSDVARIQVSYAPEPKLGLLLPREANHTFEEYERGTGLSNTGAGGSGRRLRFESSAKYSNAQYTPVDLARAIR